VRQELCRKHSYAIQADEEQLRTKLEAIHAELSAPMQFKVRYICLFCFITFDDREDCVFSYLVVCVRITQKVVDRSGPYFQG